MNKLAIKALKIGPMDEDQDESPFSGSKDEGDYPQDLADELEEFGAAMAKKDYKAAADAFKSALDLCASK